MTTSIEIVFRPVEREYYEDVILFSTKTGTVSLPIKAVLKEVKLDVPTTPLMFGYCPVRETTSIPFTVKNIGELEAWYKWDADVPFSVYPDSGSILPGKSMKFRASFEPTEAVVGNIDAVMNVDGPDGSVSQFTIVMSGVGKYPHISCPQASLDFGNVIVKRSAEKSVVITNTSVVRTSYRVKRIDRATGDTSLTFEPKNGSLEPNEQVTLRVTYSPQIAAIETAETLEMRTPGGNKLEIVCRGKSCGPRVSLSSSAVNFGQLPIGKSSKRIIQLNNPSESPASYAFHASPDGVFAFSSVNGTMRPKSSHSITMRFTPTQPINYYKRIHCVVFQQGTIYLDAIGNGYSEELRPMPIFQRHIKRFRERERSGLSKYAPEQLEKKLEKDALTQTQGKSTPKPKPKLLRGQTQAFALGEDNDNELDFNANGNANADTFDDSDEEYNSNSMSLNQSEFTLTDEKDKDVKDVLSFASFSEFCLRNGVDDGETLPVGLHVRHIELGSCLVNASSSNSVTRPINFFNRTKGKVAVNWHVPKHGKGVFTVSPMTMDVVPDTAAQFQLAFSPSTDNQSFAAELECVVSYKTMRNFRLVNETTICPPWTLPLIVTGNSVADTDRFTPEVNVSPSSLLFPPCHVGSATFQTVRLKNTGDTVVTYKFTTSGAYSVFPSSGFVRAKSDCIVVVRFKPENTDTASKLVKVTFNGNVDTTKDIRVIGKGQTPSIQLKGIHGDSLFFRPTAVHHETVQEVKLKNPCHLPVQFTWTIPEKYHGIVSIDPMSDVLGCLETKTIHIAFTPKNTHPVSVPLGCAVISAQPVDSYAEAQSMGSTLTGGVKATELADAGTLTTIVTTARSAVLENALKNPSLTLTAKGEGIGSMIRLSESKLDLGAVLMLTENRVELTIQNTSNAFTHFTTKITRVDSGEGEDGEEGKGKDKDTSVILEPSSGALAPKRKQIIDITLRATEPRQFIYLIDVFQSDKTKDGKFINSTLSGSCELLFNADIPRLFVSDVRSVGHSTDTLWRRLSIDKLNSIFAGGLEEYEMYLADDEAVLPPHKERSEIESLKKRLNTVVLDLIGSEQGSPDTEVHVMLENRGPLPSEYSILFPREIETQLEHWADLGLPTEESERLEFIEENDIFSVRPAVGVIEPNCTEIVTVRYSHKLVGVHDITLLLAINHGHHVLLNVRGTAHARGAPRLEPILSFSEPFTLTPVALGDANSPIQRYQLHNVGLVALEYAIDQTPLQEIANNNYEYDVIKCLTPTGFLAPGSKAWVKWQFDPIEEKEYCADVPIKITSIPSATFNNAVLPSASASMLNVIKLSGRGVHPSSVNRKDEGDRDGEGDREDGDGSDSSPRDLTTSALSMNSENDVDEEPEKEKEKEKEKTPSWRSSAIEGPPLNQMLSLEGQIVELSIERIDFGVLPTHGRAARIVVIRNRSLRDAVEYRWDVMPEACERLVECVPARGVLKAGGVAVCKVVVKGGHEPLYLDFDAICFAKVIKKSKKRVGKAKTPVERMHHIQHLEHGDAGEGESEEEEVFAASGTFESSLVKRKPVTTVSTRERMSVSARMPVSAAVLKHKDALETLTRSVSKADEYEYNVHSGEGEEGEGEGEGVGVLPSTSASSVLSTASTEKSLRPSASATLLRAQAMFASDDGLPVYLHIKATIQSANRMPSTELSKFFIPLGMPMSMSGKDNRDDQVKGVNENGRNILETLMSDILREIACDDSIKGIIEALPNAPVPYFEQLRPTDGEEGDGLESKHPKSKADKVSITHDSRFSALSEEILENTILNLVSEAIHGEFDLCTMPRQLVVKGSGKGKKALPLS